jgi:hypothetical protein
MPANNAGTNGSQAPVVLNARALSYSLRHKSARTKEKTALGLMNGEVGVSNLNRMQAAKLCHIPYAKLAKKPATPLSTMMISAWWNQASPDERAALIHEFGVSDVWDAIASIID